MSTSRVITTIVLIIAALGSYFAYNKYFRSAPSPYTTSYTAERLGTFSLLGKRNATGGIDWRHEAYDDERHKLIFRRLTPVRDQDFITAYIPSGKHKGRYIWVEVQGMNAFMNDPSKSNFEANGDIFERPPMQNHSLHGGSAAYPNTEDETVSTEMQPPN